MTFNFRIFVFHCLTDRAHLQVDIYICLSIRPLCYWSIPQILASHWWTLMRHWKLSSWSGRCRTYGLDLSCTLQTESTPLGTSIQPFLGCILRQCYEALNCWTLIGSTGQSQLENRNSPNSFFKSKLPSSHFSIYESLTIRICFCSHLYFN